MNKAVKVILNILIALAGIFLFITLIYLGESIKYANREVEDPVDSNMSVFEYELEHKAYDEIMGHYYSERLSSMEAPEGMEPIYRVAEYAHSAFMKRVYEEKGDADKVSKYSANMERLRNELGAYEYAADDLDGIVRNAP